jgi:tetratricopeptide (TPR) repeat protein
LTRITEFDPSYEYAYSNRGFAYSRLGEYDLAFQGFGRAVEINPDNAWIYYYCGLTYIDLGQNAEAMADLKLSMTLDRPSLNEQRQAEAEALLQELQGD